MKFAPIENNPGDYRFHCPGCNEEHVVYTQAPHINGGAKWYYNGNHDKPTIQPSLLIRSGHYVPEHKNDSCWCTYNEEHKEDPAPFSCSVCHSFITDGNIQFLNDCTHHLAGQTVELPDIA